MGCALVAPSYDAAIVALFENVAAVERIAAETLPFALHPLSCCAYEDDVVDVAACFCGVGEIGG